MKVFDFDNTLYDGESSLDFFLFCLRRKKSLIKYLPAVLINLIRYKAGRAGLDTVYEFGGRMMKVFFENRRYADTLVEEFCSKNAHKLKPELMRLVSEKDTIISASPRFLLEGFADRINTKNLICTETKGNKVEFLCYGKNKVKAFREYFGGTLIDEFYTDSVSDAPMMCEARRAFMVKGRRITEVNPHNLRRAS